jgi:DNA repair protein RadC
MKIRLTREQKIDVVNSADVYKVMQQVLLREHKIRRNQEHFWVVGLNNANKLLFIELVSLGASNRVQIAPPEVFRIAIYKLATKMVLVHNHPSGNMLISRADKDFTDRMIKSGKMLNIEVVDHLVISETDYYSFEEAGLMKELRNSGMYELVEREKAGLNELRILETKLAIATNLKREGASVDLIMKSTGLKKSQINKLK